MATKILTHGKRYTYLYYGCKCPPCTQANRDYAKESRDRRAAAGLPKDDTRHGKWSTYINYRCRCHLCAIEAQRVNAEHRAKREAARA